MSSRHSNVVEAQGSLRGMDQGNPSDQTQHPLDTSADECVTPRRLRTLTEKGLEQFELKCEQFTEHLINYTRDIQQLLSVFSNQTVDKTQCKDLKDRLHHLFTTYETGVNEYCNFLTTTHTETSLQKRNSVETVYRSVTADVNSTLSKMQEFLMTGCSPRQSVHSNASRRSHASSSLSSELARQRAKAEAAKTRLEFEKKQLDLKLQKARLEEEELKSKATVERKKTELEISMNFIEKESEAAVAEAEYTAFRDELEEKSESYKSLPLPNADKLEQTKQFVLSNNNTDIKPVSSSQDINQPVQNLHSNDNTIKVAPQEQGLLFAQNTDSKDHIKNASSQVQSDHIVSGSQSVNNKTFPRLNPDTAPFVPKSQQQSMNIDDVATFLIKKDLLVQRLTTFDDRPETFATWKSSFNSIVKDLRLTAAEEFDLLIKWLGPESKKYAVSLRSSNTNNLSKGLERLWERLQERYGSPEMVEAALKKKLGQFPKLGNKDSKKLYELSDILCEIESCMENPTYCALLSYFNTSSGVLPIVSKLPYHLQGKWTSRASKYKKIHCVAFPPFAEFCIFVREMASMANDPSFACITDAKEQSVKGSFRPSGVKSGPKQFPVSVRKTHVNQETGNKSVIDGFCPIHNAKHTLNQCRAFGNKSMSDRKRFLREHNICYKCCETDTHVFKNCPVAVICSVCGSDRHPSALHIDERQREHNFAVARNQGREGAANENTSVKECHKTLTVETKCTNVCGQEFTGRSCAKIVPVKVFPCGEEQKAKKVYAILDDQSNRTLAKSELFDMMGVSGETSEQYTLVSCAGTFQSFGRRALGLVVSSLDSDFTLALPGVLECNEIPDNRLEIPSPEVTRYHDHLRDVPIPQLDPETEILLLIGRDVPEAHHVLEQQTGPRNSPFAQRLDLGWVIIGDVCTGKIHRPDHVRVLKTSVFEDGRPTIFPQCDYRFSVKEDNPAWTNLHHDVFSLTKNDNKEGLSVEDKIFLKIMDEGFRKDENGHWSAPLPFRNPRSRLPDNRPQALRRAEILDKSLKRDDKKRQHFVEFMDKILENGHAEVAPPLKANEECWFLPIFGVYHPKKKDQIRAVFDSSAKYAGLSLNSVLLSGPDLTNSLIGILMRFRNNAIGITADVRQMFYQFYVHEQDRNYLRFFWYKDNDTDNDLIEYRMCVHVFGNSPSPAVAMYGMNKVAEMSVETYGIDVKDFINKNFYVDDGITSLPSAAVAISLMERTQRALLEGGNIKLHKIASNDKDVLNAFSEEDLDKSLRTLDLTHDMLPVQRSLGLGWDLERDCFVFNVTNDKKNPPTKRGVLSTVNSLYDPLGFLAPVTIGGKLLLREITAEVNDWDEPLSKEIKVRWESWLLSLQELALLAIPRTYFPVSVANGQEREIHVFSDASEKAIAAVAFLKMKDESGLSHVSFAFGKSKVAPKHGHTIPRLELCAAVLAVEVAETLSEELGIPSHGIKFYTDSKVVLGYLKNKTRRFYVYVENRVNRIHQFASPDQWMYVSTDKNPADHGTRYVAPADMRECSWLTGEVLMESADICSDKQCYPLVSPENDCEIRQEVKTAKTNIVSSNVLGTKRFERFSDLRRLIVAVSLLIHITSSFITKDNPCQGWHACKVYKTVRSYNLAKDFVIRQYQAETYKTEIEHLQKGKPVPQTSSILSLSPFLDDNGILRVGGRLKRTQLTVAEKHPVVVPARSHLALLIVRHYHQSVSHQGRHFTEGAVREAGYWIVGGKRLINFVIFKCVTCRKLRGKLSQQRMADLPVDRVTPAPPFSFVGVDVFGPWNVVARKTRGGVATSKRWAVLFVCQTTRAIHLEVIEEMSSSSFINAVRRFYSIRGKVQEFRSDRGTNFVGATDDLKIDAIYVEDGELKNLLYKSGTVWRFNPPHASHMGGSWERLIGVSRRVLDSVLMDNKNLKLTHEVLTTFLSEVMAIVNSRPLVPVSTDPSEPFVLTPSVLLTQKTGSSVESFEYIDIKDTYRAQWKQVQFLADMFWSRWRREYIQNLQLRSKWCSESSNIQEGDIVLVRDKSVSRNEWPLGLVKRVFPSEDNLVRKVELRMTTNGKVSNYTRPVAELVKLL